MNYIVGSKYNPVDVLDSYTDFFNTYSGVGVIVMLKEFLYEFRGRFECLPDLFYTYFFVETDVSACAVSGIVGHCIVDCLSTVS